MVSFKFLSAASLMALFASTASAEGSNHWLAVGYNGPAAANPDDGCTGDVVFAIEGDIGNAFSECQDQIHAFYCVTFHNIEGSFPDCQIRNYEISRCDGPFHEFGAALGSYTTENTDKRWSFNVFCAAE